MLRKPAHLFRAAALALVFSAAAPHAHAGTFEWVDQMFTFREDQRERVSPRRNLPPKVVLSPSYDENDHQSWSGYYTRQDLEPQTYIAGSGSKVMRPTGPLDNGVGAPGGQYGAGPQGPSTYIGDPGTGPGMVLGASNADVGGATRIGPATQDWRGNGGDAQWGNRAGDYNYRLRADNNGYAGQRDYRGNGNVMWSGDGDGQPGTDSRYYKQNGQGQVTGYRVQRGDTLSGISSQPRIYDNWRLWPLIYSANRKVIGRDPDVLSDGQKLGIPRGYSAGQARAAERKAAAHGQGVYGDGK